VDVHQTAIKPRDPFGTVPRLNLSLPLSLSLPHLGLANSIAPAHFAGPRLRCVGNRSSECWSWRKVGGFNHGQWMRNRRR
jgi:hypothetical protein